MAWGRLSKRVLTVAAVPMLLGGCALPVPVQIASWALDGISYMATQKSVADHGISLAADQDCALFRGVTEGQICREGDPTAAFAGLTGEPEPDTAATEVESTQVALAETRIQTETALALPGPELAVETPPEAGDLPDFAVASGPAEDPVDPVEKTAEEAPRPGLLATVEPVAKPAPTARPMPPRPTPAKAIPVAASNGVLDPEADLFYVIGSFGSRGNAVGLAERYGDLGATVYPVTLDDGTVYRVVIGPFREDQMKAAGRRLYENGVRNAWGARIDPYRWQETRLDAPRAPVTDSFSVAALPD